MISECLFQWIVEGEYIDLAELPPVKGKLKTMPAQLDGQPILIPLQEATAWRHKKADRGLAILGAMLHCLHSCNGHATHAMAA